MENLSAIEKAIANVRGSGFWCPATETRIKKIVAKMKSGGIENDKLIAEVIKDFWTAMSAEYGE